MTPRATRLLTALALLLLLGLIWSRPVVLALPATDSWPLLIGLIFLAIIGRPWKPRLTPRPVSALLPALGLIVLALGLIGQLLVLMALGWSLFLYIWLRTFFHPPGPLLKLILLAVFSFPWIATDLTSLGWFFRLSAARVTEGVFALLGFSIEREGTLINIQGLPISVEPACAGMNLLPALLLAGTALGVIFLANSPRFWLFVLLLTPLAWLANTLRIVVISGVALTWGSTFASGLFHEWGGLLILVFMLALSLGVVLALAPPPAKGTP